VPLPVLLLDIFVCGASHIGAYASFSLCRDASGQLLSYIIRLSRTEQLVGRSSLDISGGIPVAEYPSPVRPVGDNYLAIHSSSGIHRTRRFADSLHLLSVLETASCVAKKSVHAQCVLRTQKRTEFGVEKAGRPGHRSQDDRRSAFFDTTNGAGASIIISTILNSSILSHIV